MELRLLEVERRLEALESAPVETRLDHRGLFIVAGEGLRGGGPIDAKVSLAVAFQELSRDVPRMGDEAFPYYDPQTNGHFVVNLLQLAERILNLSGFPERLEDFEHRLKAIEDRVNLLSLYERVERLEEILRDG